MSASSVAAPTIIPLKHQQLASFGRKDRKGSIKTDIPIELSSDTASADIYYTVNGDKPEPFSAPSSRRRNKSTIRYTKPFTLPTGKLTIRAVAVKDNGVASSVVTREFVVEQAPIEEVVSTSMHIEEVEESSEEEEDDSSTDEDTPARCAVDHGYTQHPLRDTHQLTAALKSKGESLTGDNRICLQCSHQFQSDPGVHYCPRCSYPMPPVPTPLPEPHPSHFSSCPRCHAAVPKSLPSCPSCSTSMDGVAKVTRIIAQYNQNIKGGIMCDYCGTVNTRDSHLCVTCERNITPLQHCTHTKKVYPLMFCGAEESSVMCSVCGRVNARDARFCDWCGVQPKKTIMDVMCCVCSTPNNWQAHFCTSCKFPIDPAIRPSHVDRSSKWKVTDRPDGCVWYPVVEAEDKEVVVEKEEPVSTVEQGTQTRGFFKSARSMEKLQSAVEDQLNSTGQHPAPPHVAAYSPGRGFWRQQVDHVAHHLRVHTANCEEFQQAFGQLQMGKLSSAAVSESKSEAQATLTLTFPLKDKAKGASENDLTAPALLSHTNKKGNSFRMGSIAQLAITANKAKKAFSKPTHLSAEGYLLIKELSEGGKGRADIVRQLIEEGGSVNTTSELGDPLTCLAASGGRCDALKVLVDCGADLTKSSRNGDTALHVAVWRGDGNTACVELLLKSGCNPKAVNRAGLTPVQAAQEKGYSKLSALLTAHMGSAMLRSLLK